MSQPPTRSLHRRGPSLLACLRPIAFCAAALSTRSILADEMGLGKTLQSISLLAYLKETAQRRAGAGRGGSGSGAPARVRRRQHHKRCTGGRRCTASPWPHAPALAHTHPLQVDNPHLVLVPKSTLGNWAREFARWAPDITVLKLQGANKEERQRLVREKLLSRTFEVVVCSYETAVIEHAAFRRFNWDYIVIDEAHRIKNEKSVLARRVRELRSRFRLLLTGTPLQNTTHELWALLNFMLPHLFNSVEDFEDFMAGVMTFEHGKAGENEMVKKLHTVSHTD